MDITYLPSSIVVDAAIFLFWCCYDGYCLTKNSTTKFLTHNKSKNQWKLHELVWYLNIHTRISFTNNVHIFVKDLKIHKYICRKNLQKCIFLSHNFVEHVGGYTRPGRHQTGNYSWDWKNTGNQFLKEIILTEI